MSGNILIVDDSPIERKIISRAIRSRLKDVVIFEADNGLNISKILLEYKINACILDIIMPAKDGFEILEEIKENYNLIDVPIIVCTGISDKDAVEKALSLGAYDYFSKPLSEDAIKISLPLKVRNAIDFMKRKEEIMYLSYNDQLTGLYNRRFFDKELNRINIEGNLPLTIIMGDLNGLKLINDSFGHEMGDEVIRKVAKAMKQGCRQQDILVRLAGDEFVIVLSKTEEAEARKVIENIKKILLVDKIELSVSFGYGCKYSDTEKIENILKMAEDMMYERKLFESQSMRKKTIKDIMNAVYKKNHREEEHSHAVSQICKSIGEAIGMTKNEIKELMLAGELHDIGKIALDDKVLDREKELSNDEWREFKRHSEIGYRMINTVNDMSNIASFILYHHERWDGNGYPKGLSGEEIPLESRIINIADAYDVMTNSRKHKTKLSKEAVINELQQNAGNQFDPNLINIVINKILE